MSIDVQLASNGAYWQASWFDHNGERRKKGLGAKAKVSEAAAQRKCRELAARFIVTPTASGQSKAPQLGPWLARYKSNLTGLADATIVNINLACASLEEFFKAETRLDKITRARVADYCAWLPKQSRKSKKVPEPISKYTIYKYVSLSRQILQRAVDEDAIAFNPFDRVKLEEPEISRKWRYVSDEEMAKILDACPSRGWRCAFALARWAGLRRAEAWRLRWDEIDWDTPSLTVFVPEGESESTKRATREGVPIQPVLLRELRAAFEQAPAGASLVIDFPLPTNSLKARSIIRKAGFEPWRKPLHTLRKNLITDWETKAVPMDVSAWVGNDPKVAQRFYHQVKPESLAAITGKRPDEVATLRAEIERLTAQLAATQNQSPCPNPSRTLRLTEPPSPPIGGDFFAAISVSKSMTSLPDSTNERPADQCIGDYFGGQRIFLAS